MTEPLDPQREAALKHLEELTLDMRLAYAQVWAMYVEQAVNFTPAGSFDGTLVHLRWAVTELAKYVGKEPTIAEEMAYISRCLNAVQDVLNDADLAGARTLSVATVRQAADGERPDNPADRRHRLYIDGSGNGWITQSVTSDGTHWIGRIGDAALEATTDAVRAETGGLREIGRCW